MTLFFTKLGIHLTCLFFMSLCFLSIPLQAERIEVGKDSVKNGMTMELGGVFTLDFNRHVSELDNPYLQMGKAELGANLGLSKELKATVLLHTEGDLKVLSITQAAATLNPEGAPWEMVFGQHTFNYSLLTTRLISDPNIVNEV